MPRLITHARDWYARHERALSSTSLIGGFVFDALTLKRVDFVWENIWVIAHLHESVGWAATVDPFLDDQPRGTFATRSPHRPNPISLSLCTLVAVEAGSLVVAGLDLLDGTPVLDVKPYVPLFDAPTSPVSAGWFEDRAELIFERTSDGRFEQRSNRC